ncbi:MAG: 3'-5' exonuclease [Anaerolineae bacterium]|jgi:DNA polymerase-3 subunit epsilon|nr:3'-5' exonuclease [Anaerolineae bacterium]
MLNESWLKQQRDEAAQWAFDLLQREFVIFDGETTGIDYDDEFVQLGAVDQTGTVLIDTLVRPQQRISPKAAAVHKLTNADLADAPGFPDVHAQLNLTLAGKLVIAYNADFDSRILWQTCSRYNLPHIHPDEWDCAMEHYAQFYGEWNRRHRNFRWKRLAEACVIEHIPVQDAHAAAGDCLLTLALIRKMAEARPNAS